jgi:hypothetical protein
MEYTVRFGSHPHYVPFRDIKVGHYFLHARPGEPTFLFLKLASCDSEKGLNAIECSCSIGETFDPAKEVIPLTDVTVTIGLPPGVNNVRGINSTVRSS